jgi:outer membrane protein
MENRERLVKTMIKCTLAVMLMGISLFCSCQENGTTYPEDYIGPAAEPNASLQNEAEKAGVPLLEPSAIVAIEPNGPINITINDAVIISLEKNRSLVVQKLNPRIAETFEQQALSVFDPDLRGTVSAGKTRIEDVNFNNADEEIRIYNAEAVLSEYFPTGTTVALRARTQEVDDSLIRNRESATRLGVDITQPLLRGFGSKVNLVAVNQAKIDTKISQYELRGFVEALVARVEETYWIYSLAKKSIEIFQSSLKLAEEQLMETEERIKEGALAASELVAAKAEVALRKQNLIVAQNVLEQTRLNLIRLLNPGGNEMWQRDITLKSEPGNPAVELEPVQSHVAQGLQMRPEINQTRLLIERDELELVRTRNGLLPQLDFFVTLGKTGFADSFGESVENIFEDSYDVLAGVNFEYPPVNRLAKAQHQRATFSRQQAQEALDNLAQLVEVDVRGAYIQILSNQEQIVAAKATRELQEEKLKVETEKFEVGKSTYLLVAQAQRDLLASQLTEIQAIIGYQIAIIELYRLEGTLLLRSGIDSPGSIPVKETEKHAEMM